MKSLVTFLLLSASCLGQTYPRWFLDPVELNCGLTACGYAQDFFHESSSDSIAFLNACKSIALDHYVKIEGGEAYWATEAGVYWMGNDITETIDSTYLRLALSHFRRLCSYSSRSMTIVLVSASGDSVPSAMRELVVCPTARPAWVDTLPQGSGYIYAEGVAPEYFYESSSWQSAEKKARFNLARDVKITVQSLTMQNSNSGEDIRNDVVSAELRNIQVVHRWRDAVEGLYYVLVRMRN